MTIDDDDDDIVVVVVVVDAIDDVDDARIRATATTRG